MVYTHTDLLGTLLGIMPVVGNPPNTTHNVWHDHMARDADTCLVDFAVWVKSAPITVAGCRGARPWPSDSGILFGHTCLTSCKLLPRRITLTDVPVE
jgi:hypothetical protein